MPDVKCKICQETFFTHAAHLNRGLGKYCSISCRNKSQLLGKNVFCFICKKEIHRSPQEIKHSKSGRFFCSKSCQTMWKNSSRLGEKHPNWTGGGSIYREILIRTGKKQICTFCHLEDERVLAAHHIDHNRKNNVASNLTWLCWNCHYLIHHDENLENILKIKIQNDNMVPVAHSVRASPCGGEGGEFDPRRAPDTSILF